MTRLLTIEEAAAVLRVSSRSVYRLVWTGKLPAGRRKLPAGRRKLPAGRIGRQWRIAKENLYQWIEERAKKEGRLNVEKNID